MAFTQDEQAFYAAVFKKIDKDNDGVVSSADAGQWIQTVISKFTDPATTPQLFAALWQMATGAPLQNRNGAMPIAPQEWFNAMRGIACIQNGATTPQQLMQEMPRHPGFPLPSFGAVTFQALFNLSLIHI
eukprot:TRINITY_DN30060_c0_g2_i1.p1 TRINITY_DN30060_c0_g2~~TRINITY_DN30060_c0_g2_i1.p1  ORF type:complete len:130 (+),score=31.72 TRINITY_DN30060_c0_g2_i1:83-472(+)